MDAKTYHSEYFDNSGKGTPLDNFINKNFGDDAMQKYEKISDFSSKNSRFFRYMYFCSDGVYTYLGIDPKSRVCHRAFAQDDDGNTFMCIWEFSECPSTACPLGCICDMCMGCGPWLDGPCRCIIWEDKPSLTDDDFDFHKIPVNVAWNFIDTREKLAVYEVDPGFVYTKDSKAHDWYFQAKKEANEEDGVYREKHARRIRKEKKG